MTTFLKGATFRDSGGSHYLILHYIIKVTKILAVAITADRNGWPHAIFVLERRAGTPVLGTGVRTAIVPLFRVLVSFFSSDCVAMCSGLAAV